MAMMGEEKSGAVSGGGVPELTILMPCLNEVETLASCIGKARGFLARTGIVGEVLVADNGSTDGSAAMAASLGARVVSVAARGYGSAVRGGIAAAKGRYIIMGDADDSYDFSRLDPFVEKLRQGCDLVMGNRFAGGIAPGAMPLLHRYLGNPVLSGIGRLFFHCPIGDFHCGLRGFSREAIEALDLATTGMEFASEMVVKACLQGLSVAEVPVTLAPDGRGRPPHLRSWRDGWRHLRFLLLFSPRWLFFYPGFLLMTLGLASMLWLAPGPRTLGGLTLDVNTLVYCGAAIVCGYQGVIFSLFTKVFTIDAGLLPDDPKVVRAVRIFSVEFGIIVGALLLLAGLGGSLYAVGYWGSAAFGDLDPVRSLRIVIPAATALVAGLQTVFSSFFLGVLGLGTKK